MDKTLVKRAGWSYYHIALNEDIDETLTTIFVSDKSLCLFLNSMCVPKYD